MKNTEMNHFPIKVKIVEPTPWYDYRVILALRRIVWLIGWGPVLVLSSLIGIFGVIISKTWYAILWITGSTEIEIKDYPIVWMLDVADWIEKSWRLLKE